MVHSLRLVSFFAISSIVVSLTPLDAKAAGVAPEIRSPTRMRAVVGRELEFPVSARDPDGGPVALQMKSALPEGGQVVDLGGGKGRFSITPTLAQAGSVQVLEFIATDSEGLASTSKTDLKIGLRLGFNPPEIYAARLVQAPAGQRTEFVVEVTDPDGSASSLSLAAPAELQHSVSSIDLEHFLVTIQPGSSLAGREFTVTLNAQDSSGVPNARPIIVRVPAATGVETMTLEVRWSEPSSGDPYDPPEHVQIFRAPSKPSRLTGDAGQLLGYAIYVTAGTSAGTEEDFLVGIAPATYRNAWITFSVPAAKNHIPYHVTTTSRQSNGESSGSKESSTEVPRFPSIKFKDGKISITADGSNIVVGASLEVLAEGSSSGEKFALQLNKKETKWVVKASATSTPAGQHLSDLLPAGQVRYLMLHNPSGAASEPYQFTP